MTLIARDTKQIYVSSSNPRIHWYELSPDHVQDFWIRDTKYTSPHDYALSILLPKLAPAWKTASHGIVIDQLIMHNKVSVTDYNFHLIDAYSEKARSSEVWRTCLLNTKSNKIVYKMDLTEYNRAVSMALMIVRMDLLS